MIQLFVLPCPLSRTLDNETYKSLKGIYFRQRKRKMCRGTKSISVYETSEEGNVNSDSL